MIIILLCISTIDVIQDIVRNAVKNISNKHKISNGLKDVSEYNL